MQEVASRLWGPGAAMVLGEVAWGLLIGWICEAAGSR
jgi:hypothetical protein